MTITDFILLMIWTTLLLISFKFMKASITITYRQEFSDEDRQLLEDLYNKDGELKDGQTAQETLDEVVRSINSIMLDTEEDTNE